MADKLFVYGTVTRVDGSRGDVHYVHEIEEGKAQVTSASWPDVFIDIDQPYSQIKHWRKQINIQVTEVKPKPKREPKRSHGFW